MICQTLHGICVSVLAVSIDAYGYMRQGISIESLVYRTVLILSRSLIYLLDPLQAQAEHRCHMVPQLCHFFPTQTPTTPEFACLSPTSASPPPQALCLTYSASHPLGNQTLPFLQDPASGFVQYLLVHLPSPISSWARPCKGLRAV